MKKLIIFLAIIFTVRGFSQILEPVKWSTEVKKISDFEYELITVADIEKGWHLYSQSIPEGGPKPTVFTFEGNGKYQKKGNTKEEKGRTIKDRTFKMRIKFFEKKATFTQCIKLKNEPPFKINSEVQYMVCNDMQCLFLEPENLIFTIQ